MKAAKQRRGLFFRTNKHIGSDFDDFLAEEGALEECTLAAQIKVMAALASEIRRRRMLKEGAIGTITPATAVLNDMARADLLSAPRMLSLYEQELLRMSKKQIAARFRRKNGP